MWDAEARSRSETGGTQPVIRARSCLGAVFSGTDPRAVGETPTDVVVGPVRFGALGDAARSMSEQVSPTGRLRVLKSPATVSGTTLPFVRVTVSTSGTATVRIVDEVASLADAGPAVRLDGPGPCGLDGGFVQYPFGFATDQPTCARITVHAADGTLLGSATVGLAAPC